MFQQYLLKKDIKISSSKSTHFEVKKSLSVVIGKVMKSPVVSHIDLIYNLLKEWYVFDCVFLSVLYFKYLVGALPHLIVLTHLLMQ